MIQLLKNASKEKKLTVVVIFSAIYLVAEVIGGILTKSLALLADAGHMLTDVGGLILALVAFKIAARKANNRQTYGYYRVEILATVINAVVLIGISVYVLYEAYLRFRNPPEVESGSMLIVAIVGLAVNLIGMLILKDSASESLNMKGAYFEVLSDMLTSLGVIAAGIIMITTKWYYADPILSAGIGLMILPRTYSLLKEAVNILMEGTPKDVDLEKLRAGLSALPNVTAIHDLHVWALTSNMNALSVHIVVANAPDYNEMIKAANDYLLRDFKIDHTTIQLENEGYSEQEIHL